MDGCQFDEPAHTQRSEVLFARSRKAQSGIHESNCKMGSRLIHNIVSHSYRTGQASELHHHSHSHPLTIRSSSSAATTATPTAPTSSNQFRVDILSESLPYIQKFRGKTIVVKYGGAAMKRPELKASVVSDLVLLSCVGLRPVLVHGGGPEINHWLKLLNIEPLFHEGLRVTDAKTMEIVSMVLVGKVNKDLVSLINKAGATAVGLSGMDGRLLMAKPTPNSAQLGFVGEVARIDPTILQPLVNNGHIPVIASVAADELGQSYNINADTVAGEVAAALGAEKLILLTDVAGYT
ncbi:hypothetical protein OIU84_000011 [Salix udensis]|uniref:acetylglutamate kinase n=1 Tax=Salix udensis TaxID=889485 RepID=A0AAD6L4W5_9ROSI|nr:hypothetical protein OIU84_000011 [Salix udensis]